MPRTEGNEFQTEGSTKYPTQQCRVRGEVTRWFPFVKFRLLKLKGSSLKSKAGHIKKFGNQNGTGLLNIHKESQKTMKNAFKILITNCFQPKSLYMQSLHCKQNKGIFQLQEDFRRADPQGKHYKDRSFDVLFTIPTGISQL